jgi:hypothetical protein
MKRLNPETGEIWKYGDVGPDGRFFLTYRKDCGLDDEGNFRLQFASPEAFKRRTEKAIKKTKELYDKNKAFVDSYKMKRGCACCSWKDFPEGLDLDHKNPEEKYQDISSMLTRQKSILLAELAKCIVLCACCHRLKTARPKEFKKRLALHQEALLQAAEDGAL